MRIAIASASFPSVADQDPVFPASWELACALRKAGHQVLVMTFCADNDPLDTDREVNIEGLRVLRKRRDYSTYAAFSDAPALGMFSWQVGRARELYMAFEQALDEFKPDVIECQEFNGLGFFWAAQRKYPLVVRCYGPASMFMRSGDTGKFSLSDVELTEAMELSTLNAADGLITICNDLAERLSLGSGRPLADFQIIRTPVSLPELQPTRLSLRGDDEFPVLFWGRVERQKGADLLIESLPEVVRKFPRTRLWIGGQETTEYMQSKPYADSMRSRLEELGLADRVDFLGFLERQQMRQRIQNADICLFPSRYETACYSALEALCEGGCVLASRVGGMAEYQKHGQSSWLVEPDNAQALADGIMHLAADGALRLKLSQAARNHVADFCNPQNTALESLKVYEHAVESFKSRNERAELPFMALSQRIGLALEDKVLSENYSHLGQEYLSGAWQAGYEQGIAHASQNRPPGLSDYLLSFGRRIKRKLAAGSVKLLPQDLTCLVKLEYRDRDCK